MAFKHKTPLLDQLETGPWPSFVSDIKREAESRKQNERNIDYQIPVEVCDDLWASLSCPINTCELTGSMAAS